MLDIKYISANKDEVIKKLSTRGDYASLIEKTVSLHDKKCETQKNADNLRHQRKTISKQIGVLKSKGEPADDVMKQVADIKTKLTDIEHSEKDIDKELKDILLTIPNIPADDVPIGNSEDDNVELPNSKYGQPREFDFSPLPHYDIGENLGILDFERGAKITGSGFTLYRNIGATLERALINLMLDTHIADGYLEQFVPFIVNRNSLIGTGQLPKFEEDLYKLNEDNLFLNPTAEVALVNMYHDEILDEDLLTLDVVAYAPSFRKEAGSYGKDTRGIIRQHQFNKVELVKFCKPEDSADEQEKILKQAGKILELLELPYRVVTLCTGDMGFSAAKTYDIEVWLPSQNQYKEISSVSNCLDFQARRANIRFRRKENKKVEYVHTLNGSGLAVGRTVVAILENYQQSDGSIDIPKVLQKYIAGIKKIEKK